MSSTYSSSLLHRSDADLRDQELRDEQLRDGEPRDGGLRDEHLRDRHLHDGVRGHSIPRPGSGPTRSVTHVVAQPPMHAPVQHAPQMWQQAPQPVAPVFVQAGSRGGAVANGLSVIALAVIVVLVGIAALAAGYFATKAAAPSTDEASLTTSLAAQEGYVNGRNRGLQLGRVDGAAAAGTTAQLRASIARQRAWDSAFQRGVRAGQRSYRAPRSYGYGGGYRGGYRSSGFGYSRGVETMAALGTAQSIANATGAPVDVEIY